MTKCNLPYWLKHENVTVSKPSDVSFLQKTLKHLSLVFAHELLNNKNLNHGIARQLPISAKVLSFLLFIVAANVISNIKFLFILPCILLVLALINRLHMNKFILRTWCTIPLIVFIFSLPALLNIFINGVPILWLVKPNHLFLYGLYISDNGIHVLGRMVLRCGISLMASYIFIATTSWKSIKEFLLKLHMPKLLILIFDMTYRYIFLLAVTGVQASEARLLRSVGRLSTKNNRRFLAHLFATLFIKTNYISQNVYSAMRLRGYKQ